MAELNSYTHLPGSVEGDGVSHDEAQCTSAHTGKTDRIRTSRTASSSSPMPFDAGRSVTHGESGCTDQLAEGMPTPTLKLPDSESEKKMSVKTGQTAVDAPTTAVTASSVP